MRKLRQDWRLLRTGFTKIVEDGIVPHVPHGDTKRLLRTPPAMLDPNHRDCVFNPEEMEALLRDGSAGVAIPCLIEEDTQVTTSRPRKVPIRMASALRKIYSKMDAIRSAYLTVVRWEHNKLHPTLFIAVIVNKNDRERALRATVAAIQPHITEPGLSIDVAAVDPEKKCSHPFAKGTRIYQRS